MTDAVQPDQAGEDQQCPNISLLLKPHLREHMPLLSLGKWGRIFEKNRCHDRQCKQTNKSITEGTFFLPLRFL